MAKTKTKTKSNDTAANLGFEAKLWAAADALRNNMDAAEYKHVVLGLIFLTGARPRDRVDPDRWQRPQCARLSHRLPPGEGLARTPQTEFVIVSRDTGFDPLLRHLKARGLQCRREAPATPAKAAPKPVLYANAQQVVELLNRTERNRRPSDMRLFTNVMLEHPYA